MARTKTTPIQQTVQSVFDDAVTNSKVRRSRSKDLTTNTSGSGGKATGRPNTGKTKLSVQGGTITKLGGKKKDTVVSMLNTLPTRATKILNRKKKKTGDKKLNKRSQLTHGQKLAIRNEFVDKIIKINGYIRPEDPTWRQYSGVIKKLSGFNQTKNIISKWCKGDYASRAPSNKIVHVMKDALVLTGDDMNKLKFNSGTPSKPATLLGIESDQDVGEVGSDSDSEDSVTITEVPEKRERCLVPLVQADLRRSLFSPISDVVLGAFIMFLGQLEPSALEEFTNKDSTEAQETVDKFHLSIKKLINFKARDVSVYKLSVKRHLQSQRSLGA